jgi:hypothetical protein
MRRFCRSPDRVPDLRFAFPSFPKAVASRARSSTAIHRDPRQVAGHRRSSTRCARSPRTTWCRRHEANPFPRKARKASPPAGIAPLCGGYLDGWRKHAQDVDRLAGVSMIFVKGTLIGATDSQLIASNGFDGCWGCRSRASSRDKAGGGDIRG